jgi:alkylhydroperoxidase/carboxymuconolactone decarboxylase family protein YurZ
VAEVIFQMATYGGVPVVNAALKAFRTVLQEKGIWPLK